MYRIWGLGVRVYTRRGGRRVGRKVGQNLLVDLGPANGFKARDRSTRLYEEKFITREFGQFGCICSCESGPNRFFVSFKSSFFSKDCNFMSLSPSS